MLMGEVWFTGSSFVFKSGLFGEEWSAAVVSKVLDEIHIPNPNPYKTIKVKHE